MASLNKLISKAVSTATKLGAATATKNSNGTTTYTPTGANSGIGSVTIGGGGRIVSATPGSSSGGSSGSSSGQSAYSGRMPDMSRNTALAGQTVYSNGMNVNYDAGGYAVSAVAPGYSGFAGTNRSVRAQSLDAARRAAEGRADPNDLDSLVMSDKNLRDLAQIRADVASGRISAAEGNAQAEGLRALYGYSGGANGATYTKLGLTTFDPDDPTTQPGSKYYAANPNTDWTVWRQESVAGPGYTGPVSSLRQDGTFTATPYADAMARAEGVTIADTPYADAAARAGALPDTPYSDAADGYGAGEWLRELLGLYNGDESAYAKLLAANEAAKEAAVRQAVSGIDAQRARMNEAYDDLYRQAYVDKMNAQRDLEQRLAALGITGGEAESTLLGLETAYADAKRRTERQRLGEMADYDRAESDARLAGDLDLANARAEAQKEQTARRAELLRYALDRYDKLAAQQRQDALRLAQFGEQRAKSAQAAADADRAWARQIAAQLLEQGTLPDAATLAAAGITAEQAAALLPETAAEEYAPTFTPAQVLDQKNRLDKQGTPMTGNLLRDYNWYFYGDPDYGAAAAAEPAAAAGTAGTGGARYDNAGLGRDEVRAAQRAWNARHPGAQLAVDGYWGPDSRGKTGYPNARAAYDALVKTETAAPEPAEATLGERYGTISSSAALRAATEHSDALGEQLAYLEMLLGNGKITQTQYADLVTLLTGPSYK